MTMGDSLLFKCERRGVYAQATDGTLVNKCNKRKKANTRGEERPRLEIKERKEPSQTASQWVGGCVRFVSLLGVGV